LPDIIGSAYEKYMVALVFEQRDLFEKFIRNGYLRNKFPECTIHLIYEAGFKGFNLYDRLNEDGIYCVVIPPHMVTEPKVNRVKTDKRDANRLVYILENHDFKDACHVPDRERREDRQISRTLIAMQKDIIRTRNRIRKLLDFHGIEISFPDRWGRGECRALKKLSLSEPLRISLDVLLTQCVDAGSFFPQAGTCGINHEQETVKNFSSLRLKKGVALRPRTHVEGVIGLVLRDNADGPMESSGGSEGYGLMTYHEKRKQGDDCPENNFVDFHHRRKQQVRKSSKEFG